MARVSWFSSESVAVGHPDKLADQVSDAVVDHFLALDPGAHVACNTLIGHGLLVLCGEIRSRAPVDREVLGRLARQVVADAGYDGSNGFDPAGCDLELRLVEQSPDIARGVDRAEALRGLA